MKHLFVLSAVATAALAFSLSGAEIFAPKTADDFRKDSQLSGNDGVFTLKSAGGRFLSAQKFVLDPAKKYKLSVSATLKAGKAPLLFIGFAPYDAKGRNIMPYNAAPLANTDTELAEPLKKGSKTITVKDASKWPAKMVNGYIALNTKTDFSDIPNFEVLKVKAGTLVQDGGKWTCTLLTFPRKDYPEGTAVRVQKDSGTYIYSANGKVTKSIKLSGILSGQLKTGVSTSKLWPGTKYVHVLVMPMNGDKDTVLELSDLKLEEIQ